LVLLLTADIRWLLTEEGVQAAFEAVAFDYFNRLGRATDEFAVPAPSNCMNCGEKLGRTGAQR
jgi:hypothetical protein